MTELVQFIEQNPLAVAFGLMGLACQLAWPLFSARRSMLTVQLGIGSFYAMQYALIGAWSGAGIASLGATQTVVALIAGDRTWLKKLGFIFLPLVAAVCYLTWVGAPSLFALAACSLIMIGRLQDDTIALRLFLLAAAPFGMGYDISVGALPALAGGITSAVIATTMLVREMRAREMFAGLGGKAFALIANATRILQPQKRALVPARTGYTLADICVRLRTGLTEGVKMKRIPFAFISVLSLTVPATPAWSDDGAATAPADYSLASSWLCRPGRDDACTINLDTTIVASDGTLTLEPYVAATDPAFDCFYVYPTVSSDPGGNSDMEASPEELSVIKAQFARFGAVCRTFAPLYRQVTLTALRARIASEDMAVDWQLGYRDVEVAWRHYLENDNDGRAVVLVGHSQGSGVLQELIRTGIDGKPIQAQILSALLTGSRVAVPEGKGVGGAFQHMPLCTSPAQTGCIITFASFRADAPPPENTRFGQVEGEGMVAACSNPVALGGGSGALHAYMSAGISNVNTTSLPPAPWTASGEAVTTPFVSLPGMLTSQCAAGEHGTYLAITVHGDPGDARVDDIVGDVVSEGAVLADWGLHLIDMNLTMGNLLTLVASQHEAWMAAQ